MTGDTAAVGHGRDGVAPTAIGRGSGGSGGSAWPRHGSTDRPWRSSGRPPRADRMTRSVRCSLPPTIADHPYVAPPDLADLLARTTDRLVDLDRRLGDRTAAFDLLLARTEAVSSSRIEEEHATLDDYARALVGIRANGSATAMVGATTALRGMITAAGRGSITERSVLDAHAVLMRDDPVDGPVAGQWRRVQNWIGGGASPRDAAYVPPPAEDVPDAMADLFAFLARDDVDALAQAAIAHAQFESVHPFTDGNGRIGRALVNAVLRRRGVTTTLVVPVAAALVADRAGYFAELERYRDGHVDGIVALTARTVGVVCDEVEFAALRLEEIELDRSALRPTDPGPRVEHHSDLLRALLADPVLTEAAVTAALPADLPWTEAVIDDLVDAGVLRPVTARRRDRAWVASDVLAELDALAERIRAAAPDVAHPTATAV
ncbi:Fic family protein [Curtobacterium sp. MCBD17_032]|uniref:Fic family protein n=1 Tax=Curtobacterium sp. MCBD17_032 TaxID=2175659 RepID=UPI000DA7E85B|nr:Fic family protein [Curtobacterium sp. MCBD17_032]PZE82110.1 Fic family protein [Curtobacterium sp. MCBD17_032]